MIRIPDFPRLRLALAASAALAGAGCGSAPRPATPPADFPRPAPAAPPPFPGAAVPLLAPAPEAIYRNPKIGIVYLRAHQDVQGRLLGPQVMYQIVDPGGWNTGAIEQGSGYIPAANQEAPADLGRTEARPARAIPSPADSSPLLDPAAAGDIVITGLMRPEDQAAAEQLARRQAPGARAQYDAQAGWLLLPPARTP